jgi:hypothetical protein
MSALILYFAYTNFDIMRKKRNSTNSVNGHEESGGKLDGDRDTAGASNYISQRINPIASVNPPKIIQVKDLIDRQLMRLLPKLDLSDEDTIALQIKMIERQLVINKVFSSLTKNHILSVDAGEKEVLVDPKAYINYHPPSSANYVPNKTELEQVYIIVTDVDEDLILDSEKAAVQTIESDIRDLIGNENYSKYTLFQETLQIYSSIIDPLNQAISLSGSEDALNSLQKESLLLSLHEENPIYYEYRIPYVEKTMELASAILTSGQIKIFKSFWDDRNANINVIRSAMGNKR